MTETFALFQQLPSELRDHIWRLTLPSWDGATLHSYRRGYWKFTNLTTPSSMPADTDDAVEYLHFNFHHEKLDGARLHLPLMFVNHESRLVASKWCKAHNIFLARASSSADHPIFIQRFDNTRDILYVGRDDWLEFRQEVLEFLWRAEAVGSAVVRGPGIAHLAIPEPAWTSGVLTATATVASGPGDEPWPPRVYKAFVQLEVLYVVLGEQPDFATQGPSGLRSQWEVSEQAAVLERLRWDHERREFDYEGLYEGPLSRLGVVERNDFGRKVTGKCHQPFEMRTVFVTKR